MVDRRSAFATDILKNVPQYVRLASRLIGSTQDLINADGDPLEVSNHDVESIECVPLGPRGSDTTEFRSLPFDANVYVRRDRHWELRPLDHRIPGTRLRAPVRIGER
jgi:hypothetical protein